MFGLGLLFRLFEKLSYEDTSWPLLTVFHARSDGESMEGRRNKSPVVSFKHRSLTLVIIYEVHVQTHSLNDFPFALL